MIFKLLIKSMALIVILIALFSYGIYLKTGKWVGPDPTKLSMPELKMPKLKTPDINLPMIKNKKPVADKKVYKWQDEQGVWHYETQKPTQSSQQQQAEELDGLSKSKLTEGQAY